MRKVLSALALGLAATCAAVEEIPRAIQVAEPPATNSLSSDTVHSRTQQFRVSGGESLVRSTVAMLAEETKDELLRLTEEPDSWKIPVSIRLHGRAGDPMPARTMAMRLIVVDDIKELRLDVHLSRGIEQERFKRVITSALLFERGLQTGAGADPEQLLAVPPWLSDGLREATAWRLNLSDRRLYEALFKRGGLFKLDDLFALNEQAFEEMDGATRAAFRVSSGALVMALLEQPQGKNGFRAFVNEVAAYQGEMPSLMRKHFPELNLSETSLAKWWALQLAAKGGLTLLTDIMTIQQSEEALNEALRLDFPTAEGIQLQKEISAWPELAALEEPQRIATVTYAQEALVRLSYRCFPSYRPLLTEYQTLLLALSKNRAKDVETTLAKLTETRRTMLERAARGRDYLDWFEITRARETSGVFDDYQRLKERLKSNPHKRKDAVSEYLDRMDKVFYREKAKERPLMPP